FPLPLFAVFIGLWACGTSAPEPAPTGQSTESPAAQSNNISADTDSVAATLEPSLKVQPAVGTDVGEVVPHFEFTLSDGSKRSTATLASQGKPVFLFFFTTW
ncbi:MAG: hypothetical protein H8E48_09520, partial [Chloroflexi bacterium]|nr:hypothetical protein [Chloroflexota bacterium]